jgi:urea transport system substrate-binding protein
MLAHYRIVKPLGEGGMGLVYQAEDTRLCRSVALKVMHPSVAAEPAARERFLREARTVAAVRNDHVVTVYEVGEADGVPFLAMELLQGRTLAQAPAARQPLPVADVLRIGREVATGLAAAQERGLIHRDIKPANLWLEPLPAAAGSAGPAERVKILDFGLARPVDNRASLTRTGDVVGTPHYMAPEQALGKPVDGRSDLFSLGVVLYQMCTGRLPFQGATVTAVLMAVTAERPKPLRECNPALPQGLVDLVEQLLEKEPADRPASAARVVSALRALEHEPADDPRSAVPPPRQRGTARPPARRGRATRRVLLLAGAVLGMLLLAGVAAWWHASRPAAGETDGPAPAVPVGPPVRIGVLYSRTGTMAISERPVLDGILLAVEEVNQQGGVLGRPVEAVIEDGQSDEQVFARRAEKLIHEDGVRALVGCWTSASRKAVKAVVERHDHLLLYPVSYEGMEQSEHVVYGGSVPNQLIVPALRWCYGFLNKKRWFLVGSDSIFQHAAHAVVRDEAQHLGCRVVGEEFLPPGSTEVAGVVARIAAARPDLIVNAINGDTNVAFFRALRRAGIRPPDTPTLSLILSEVELQGLPPDEVVGHYAAGNYFQSLDLPENQTFLRRVCARYGPDRIVTDPMQTAYTLVHLWARAVRAAGREDAAAVRGALRGLRLDSPEGQVTIDPATLHTVQVSRVGRINRQGRFEQVFLSPQPVVPEPFPASRSRQQWQDLLEQCYRAWGGRWEKPGL